MTKDTGNMLYTVLMISLACDIMQNIKTRNEAATLPACLFHYLHMMQ